MPKGKRVAQTKEINLSAMAEAVTSLASAMKALEEKVEKLAPKPDVPHGTGEPPTPSVKPEEKKTDPFPLEWRAIINEVLNPKFDATVSYRPDAKFELTIFVPKEYSNAPPAQWDMAHADPRVRIMDNFVGEAGVREYAVKVSENLGHDIMQKVQEDRIKEPSLVHEPAKEHA